MFIVFMENVIKKILEFNVTAGQPAPHELTKLSKDRKEFRMRLIDEEVEELRVALGNNDEIEERDAIIDTIYVMIGLAIERGYANKLPLDFDVIHNNNMTKFCVTEEEAERSVENYSKQGVDTMFGKSGKYWVVMRRSDAKILKSINWKAVGLV